MKIPKKYKNLFRLKTRYCIVTGGRGSGKSFALCVRLLLNTYEKGKTILFTRYTMSSAEISIIPEFWEKVEMLGLEGSFYKTKNSIINLETGSTILFRGLKASSGMQTANLKSINNITTWVLDEAEEMIDEALFDRIDLSVRKKNDTNEVILVLNPTDNKKHFIFRKFFEGYGLTNVHNGVINNCTYIHTSYLDNKQNLDKSFLDLAELCQKVDLDKYNNIYLGQWGEQSRGLIYKNWVKIKDNEYPTDLYTWYGVDWGYSNDETAVVRICYDSKTNSIYLHEVLYQKEQQPRDVAIRIKEDYRGKETTIYKAEKEIKVVNNTIFVDNAALPLAEFMESGLTIEGVDKAFYDKAIKGVYNVLTEVYCDPARPEHIGELRTGFNISAVGAINARKESRIEFLKYFNVFYTQSSKNIEKEVNSYEWLTDKRDSKVLTNVPKDGNDHLMDAINYGAVTHLRRIGAVNNLGEK